MFRLSRAFLVLLLVGSSCVGMDEAGSSQLRRRIGAHTGGSAAAESLPIEQSEDPDSYSLMHDRREMLKVLCINYACMGCMLTPFVALYTAWHWVINR